MQFSVTLVGLAALIPFAFADCYSSGAPLPDNKEDAEWAIDMAAEHYESLGVIGSEEQVHQVTAGGKCIKFILQNIGSDEGRTIDFDEAHHGFNSEFINCSNGGDTSYTNWRYVMDYNEVCE